MHGGGRRRQRKGSKNFFFEKKKQKTFNYLQARQWIVPLTQNT
jgi:hypothetical protein